MSGVLVLYYTSYFVVSHLFGQVNFLNMVKEHCYEYLTLLVQDCGLLEMHVANVLSHTHIPFIHPMLLASFKSLEVLLPVSGHLENEDTVFTN